jgi:hypothetical protein
MEIFDPMGKMREKIFVVTDYLDGTFGVCIYKLGVYDGSYARAIWTEFPPEVAVVFIR